METRFTLCVRMDNAAFEDDPSELSRILRMLADRFQNFGSCREDGNVADYNGNRVGSYSFRNS